MDATGRRICEVCNFLKTLEKAFVRWSPAKFIELVYIAS